MSRRLLLLLLVSIALPALAAVWGPRLTGPPAPGVEPARVAEVHAVAAGDVNLDRRHVGIVVVGDSYTNGTPLGGELDTSNWTGQVIRGLDTQDAVSVHRIAAGGAGYLSVGSTQEAFGDLVRRSVTPDAQVVVVFGSRNDAGKDGLRVVARSVFADVARQAPAAKLVVVGPPWTGEDVPEKMFDTRDELKAAADAAGAVFVDPLAERWFFGPDSALIGADGVHPTDAGHTYMAQKLVPHLRAALAAVPA